MKPIRKYRFPKPLAAGAKAIEGFTLIEVLVATAVLVLLVTLVANIIQTGNFLISGSRKHLAADAQARIVFSRFALDWNRMPRRSDLDAVLSSNNNALYFFSEGPGFYSSPNASDHNSLSLVGYRVNQDAQLERLGKGLSWTNSPFLTYSTNAPATNSTSLPASTIEGAWGSVVGSSPAYDDGTDSDYHLLSDGVFRIFYCFQKPDGVYSLTLEPNAQKNKFAGASAIVLTLAVLDSESRKLVNDTSKLASALPDPKQSDLDSGNLPAELWQGAVNDVTQFASAAGIPEPAASRVRIYQRTFPLSAP